MNCSPLTPLSDKWFDHADLSGMCLGFELSGLSALTRVSHQIFAKKPMNNTRIANAITKGAINRWSEIARETAPGMTNGVCRIPIAANAKAIHLTFFRPAVFIRLRSLCSFRFSQATFLATRIDLCSVLKATINESGMVKRPINDLPGVEHQPDVQWGGRTIREGRRNRDDY